MKVVVVGAGSLIAGALRARPETAGWRFLSHRDALLDTAWLDGLDLLINCAFDPKLKHGPYDPRHDVDLQLAAALRRQGRARQIMLSSRMAYGPVGPQLIEHAQPAPDRPYGQAKWATEQALAAALGDRLTVLRLANVFGDELRPGRQNFFAMALRSLRDSGRIVLDMSPFVERDFIPVEDVAAGLLAVAAAPRPGLYNLGAGHGTPTGRIAQWLIEGHGSGQLLCSELREFDAFWLDMRRSEAAFGLGPLPVERIRQRCLLLGAALRAGSVPAAAMKEAA